MIVKNLDKYYHLGVGAAISLIGSLISPPIGLLACMVAAYAKERYDKANPTKHTYDGWDAFATGVGSLVGVTIVHTLVVLGYWNYVV